MTLTDEVFGLSREERQGGGRISLGGGGDNRPTAFGRLSQPYLKKKTLPKIVFLKNIATHQADKTPKGDILVVQC